METIKNHLILNIIPGEQRFTIQINKRDSNGTCYNVEFKTGDNYLILDGFMVPCFNSNCFNSIYGNRETRTLQHCLKVLPKLKDNSKNIFEFIVNLIKKERLNHFQININGSMDYSNAQKIDLATIATIMNEFKGFNLSTEF